MRRSDGRRLKTLGPFVKMIPYVIDRRTDAQVFGKQTVYTDEIEAYLREKQDEGRKLSYLKVFVAGFVRILAERPRLNRFVMNSELYARHGIHIAMAVKRSLDENAEETTVKFAFTGTENIFEVARIIGRRIGETAPGGGPDGAFAIAERVMSMPGFTKRALVGILKSLDRHNLLPKAIVDESPFHASLFFSHLKSIKTDYVYHHLYDIGTAGLFAALGKQKEVPALENGAVVARHCCEIGFTADERICDGMYLANSLELLARYMENPRLLETGLAEVVQDVG